MDVKIARWKTAKEKAIGNHLYNFARKLIEDGNLIVEDSIPNLYKEEYSKYCKTKLAKGRYKYGMMTISFKPDADILTCLKKFRKYCKKKWILKTYSCFEWGEEKGNPHIHSKFWLCPNKLHRQCYPEIRNTFKDIIDDKCHAALDIKWEHNGGDDEFEKYIEGYKYDKEYKMYARKDCMNITFKKREEYAIEDILEDMIVKDT